MQLKKMLCKINMADMSHWEIFVPVIIAVISAFVSVRCMVSSLRSQKMLQNEKHAFMQNFESYKNQLRIDYLRNEINTTHKLQIYPIIYGEFFKNFKNIKSIINSFYREQIDLDDQNANNRELKIKKVLSKNGNTDEEINSFLKAAVKKDQNHLNQIYRIGKSRTIRQQISTSEDYFYSKSLFISEDCKNLCYDLFKNFNHLLVNIQFFLSNIDNKAELYRERVKMENTTWDLLKNLEVKMKTEMNTPLAH